jgi:hypothetical protein
MEIQLHNTTKIVFLNGVPARVWEGHTASGVPVHAYITRIAVAQGEDASELDRELSIAAPPSPEIEAIPLRMIL